MGEWFSFSGGRCRGNLLFARTSHVKQLLSSCTTLVARKGKFPPENAEEEKLETGDCTSFMYTQRIPLPLKIKYNKAIAQEKPSHGR